jgi:DNA primase
VAAVEEAAPLLRAVADPLARDLYVARLAQLLGIDQGLVRRALRGSAPVAQARTPEAAIPQKPRALTPICDKLLRVLAAEPSLIQKLPVAAVTAIDDEELRALLDETLRQRSFDTQAVVQKAPPALRDAVARALLSDEKFERQGDSGNVAAAVFDDVIAALTAPRDTDSLEAACKAALKSGDHERWRELSTQLRNLRRTHAKA